MEKNPYTFSPANPRLVTNAERSPKLAPATTLFYFGSLYWYHRMFFRINNNVVQFGAFAVAALPASYVYASTFFSSAIVEAGIKNNERERTH
jgi:hypothetical protein